MFTIIVCSFWPLISSIVYCWSFSHIWLFETHGCSLPGSSVHEILQARTLLTYFTLSSLFCYVISIITIFLFFFIFKQTVLFHFLYHYFDLAHLNFYLFIYFITVFSGTSFWVPFLPPTFFVSLILFTCSLWNSS